MKGTDFRDVELGLEGVVRVEAFDVNRDEPLGQEIAPQSEAGRWVKGLRGEECLHQKSCEVRFAVFSFETC